jgi:hypothetical protein
MFGHALTPSLPLELPGHIPGMSQRATEDRKRLIVPLSEVQGTGEVWECVTQGAEGRLTGKYRAAKLGQTLVAGAHEVAVRKSHKG